MFVTISIYKAKPGEEDAIIALYEDWQRTLRPRTQGYLSGELLRSIENAREFITILHFESQEAAQRSTSSPEQDAWHRRLTSLIQIESAHFVCTSEWSVREPNL